MTAAPSRGELLARIGSPQDLKALPREALPVLAEEVRNYLLEKVQTTGGHLGSNLGTVELTIALHRVFDFLRDRLVWDVGHQCYTHKLLTGRRDRFETLRQEGGLSGFQCKQESPYDLFTTGHAGTSLSLALGLKFGGAIAGDSRRVVAVIGDASLGCGVAFEALNAAGELKPDLLVVLNDNEWSIAKTVGALSRYLNRVRTGRLYTGARRELERFLERLGSLGSRVEAAMGDLSLLARHLVVPGHVFEALGLRYYGPSDGHDVLELVDLLERTKEIEGVVILHVLTQKGMGGEGADRDPQRLHGVSPKKAPVVGIEPGKVPRPPAKPSRSFTQAFSDAMLDFAAREPRLVAITAAMPDGTGLRPFSEKFPDRFFDTGITEQHAVAFAAGLSRGGAIPVAAIYSTFLQRALDQIFQEVLVSETAVVFALDRAGLVGEDGPTHNGLFDVAFLRAYPDVTLLAPRDETELRAMLEWALSAGRTCAIRFPRASCPQPEFEAGPRPPIELGRAEVLRQGKDAVLVGYGILVYEAIAAAEALAREGIDAGVVNARFAKPIDRELLATLLRGASPLFTLEDHAVAGGFGSAVLELRAQFPDAKAPVRCLGVPDRFISHASRGAQLRACGLDAASVADQVRQALRG
jgi:1-deoxy-D-xylulose-5-phosphate synthase